MCWHLTEVWSSSRSRALAAKDSTTTTAEPYFFLQNILKGNVSVSHVVVSCQHLVVEMLYALQYLLVDLPKQFVCFNCTTVLFVRFSLSSVCLYQREQCYSVLLVIGLSCIGNFHDVCPTRRSILIVQYRWYDHRLNSVYLWNAVWTHQRLSIQV